MFKMCHDSEGQEAGHIGWKTQACWDHYPRSQVVESRQVAETLSDLFSSNKESLLQGGMFHKVDIHRLARVYGTGSHQSGQNAETNG